MESDNSKAIADYKNIKETEKFVREICNTLPNDRYVSTSVDMEGEGLDNSDEINLPSWAAISVVESFCTTLPTDDFIPLNTVYHMQAVGVRGFIATCHLPPVSEVAAISGSLQTSKKISSRLCAKLIHFLSQTQGQS